MPKVTPIKVRRCNRPATPWYVRVPTSLRKVEPRQKVFFAKEGVAKAYRDKLLGLQRNADQLAFGLTEAQRVEAAECFAMLAPKGKGLREAVEFFLTHLNIAERSAALSDLVTEVVAAKKADKFTDAYIAPFESRLRKFSDAHPETLASEFTPAGIDEWLRDHIENPTTRNNYRRDLRTMFAYAMTRRYVTSNPVAEVAKAKEAQVEVEALTVPDVFRLLHAADGVLLPMLAIGAFTGIRPEEIKRLEWRDVDFEHGEIDVRAGKSKTGQRRLVKMSPNLLAWLANYRGRDGAVLPHFPRVRFENTRLRAGVKTWPHDALRHSFASYHLAQHEDAAALALQMGHGGTDLIFRHYRKVVSERAAAAYWNIYPEGPVPI